MGNLCCAREHSVQFFRAVLYTVKLHSLTKSICGPLYTHTHTQTHTPRGADKSLARPGRKATAPKLGIYSTHSPRSSTHFFARRSNICKPLTKMQNVVCPTMSPRQQWPPCRTKNGHLSIAFLVQGTGGSPTMPDPENKVGDPSQGRPVSSGLQVLGQPGRCRARTTPLWWPLPAAFLLQNVPQLHQQRWVTLRVNSLAIWKIINEEYAVLIPNNRGDTF
jgi:hypothetical protein